MSTRNISANGIVTYWTNSDSNVERLRDACLAIDERLDPFIPKAATPMTALRLAMAEHYPNHLIRKLKRDGFAVVSEERGQDANDYDSIAAAWFEEDDTLTIHGGIVSARTIRGAYEEQRTVLAPWIIGRFMAEVLSKVLDGTMLRESGGVYWLPEAKAATWKAIGKAIEEAAVVRDKTTVYILRHAMDEDAIRAVTAAISNEVLGEAGKINADILEGNLGGRALEGRERQARFLMSKVGRYEALLNVGLGSVRQALGEVQEAAAAAALLASVDAGLGEAPSAAR